VLLQPYCGLLDRNWFFVIPTQLICLSLYCFPSPMLSLTPSNIAIYTLGHEQHNARSIIVAEHCQ
jgi:hypothetical protein